MDRLRFFVDKYVLHKHLFFFSVTSKLKTFFWFQWVVSRATLVIAANHAKLAFDIDDIISTIDMQSHYNQLRIKLASASVRQYERYVFVFLSFSCLHKSKENTVVNNNNCNNNKYLASLNRCYCKMTYTI